MNGHQIYVTHLNGKDGPFDVDDEVVLHTEEPMHGNLCRECGQPLPE